MDLTDTSVMVELVIRKKYQEFIKTDRKGQHWFRWADGR